MESQKELYGFSLIECGSKHFSFWKRRVIEFFATKKLQNFLKHGPVEDIVKAKISYALFLSLLSDGVLVSFKMKILRIKSKLN